MATIPEKEWFAEWPILTADDMSYELNYSEGSEGAHCIIGWESEVMRLYNGNNAYGICMSIQEALELACKEFGQEYELVTDESWAGPLSLMARIWNRAGALMGYTAGNPECKNPIRRKKYGA